MSAPNLAPSLAAPARSGNHVVRLVRLVLPIVVLAAGIAFWEFEVRLHDIKPYVLPAPSAIFQALVGDWGSAQTFYAMATAPAKQPILIRLHFGMHERKVEKLPQHMFSCLIESPA